MGRLFERGRGRLEFAEFIEVARGEVGEEGGQGPKLRGLLFREKNRENGMVRAEVFGDLFSLGAGKLLAD